MRIELPPSPTVGDLVHALRLMPREADVLIREGVDWTVSAVELTPEGSVALT